MKAPRENIKSTGLSVIYEPDSRAAVNLDVILVHGLGGHPVRTWLHTPANDVPAKQHLASPANPAPPSSPDKGLVRALSLRYLASPSANKGHTLKKPPSRPRPGVTARGHHATASAPAATSPPRRDPRRGEAGEAGDLATFWPSDLLPDLCRDAGILTWGFRTRVSDGMLVPGQLDIFSRGRQLLSDVNDLLSSYREHGHGRELVLVAHSTGGIIINEMLRLAYAYEDTQNRPLLASIAGIVFIACPLRDSASGTMLDAIKSMASAAVGVGMHDHVLLELLGGDTWLAYEGRDALDGIRHEYGFPVKSYREGMIIPTGDDALSPRAALALRRDSGRLEGAEDDSEHIEANHLNVCRFASAGSHGYRSVASFILRLAHHQLLRKHRLTPEDEASLGFLAPPGSSSRPSQHTTAAILPPGRPPRRVPPWLLRHPAFRSWYHRQSPAGRHKVLWLRGPAACGKSELLSSLASHISAEWSPTTHSSATVTVAVEGEPAVEAAIQTSDGAPPPPDQPAQPPHSDDDQGDTRRRQQQQQQQQYITNTEPPGQAGTRGSGSTAGGPTHETAAPLRAILSQLWAHDPRLRNLVGALAKASPLPADSCAGPRGTTQGGAGARERQPHQPKVYSRAPAEEAAAAAAAAGGGGINNVAQGPPRPPREKAINVGDREGGLAAGAGSADDENAAAGASSDHGHGRLSHHLLDDARLVSFFLEDYLRLGPRQKGKPQAKDKNKNKNKKEEEEGDGDPDNPNNTRPPVLVETPGTRRIFILVDIAPTTAPATERELLWCLCQLARRSTTLSICAASRGGGAAIPSTATRHTDPNGGGGGGGGEGAARPLAADLDRDEMGDCSSRSRSSSSMLTVDVATSNAQDVTSYIEATLLPGIDDRAALACKLASRSCGVMLWLEHAVAIVNDASEDGVSGEIVCSMLDDIAPEVSPPTTTTTTTASSTPGSRSGSSASMLAMAMAAQQHEDAAQARLDDLYAWKLRRLGAGEARAALVLMQWVMLAPEPLRLNELLVAIRLTMLAWPQDGRDQRGGGGDLCARALDVDPPMSLSHLRRQPGGGAEYVPADNPSQFWRWAWRISQGLVRLEGQGARTATNSSSAKVSSEPLGLQRVVPAHQSVRRFFLEGRGFQILTPSPSPCQPPDDEDNNNNDNNDNKRNSKRTKHRTQPPPPPPPPPTTEQLIDTSYYVLLHTCLVYLNMTDFDSLSRTTNTTAAPAPPRTPCEPPSEAEASSQRLHRSNTEAQRALVTSSYPFLRYTVDNLVFHLLRPRALRYFPPQAQLLRLLTADGCRIWRRWTRLLGIPDGCGCGGAGADAPSMILGKARARRSAAVLLRPVYGASYRIERVLRRACKTAGEQATAAARARPARPRPQRSLRGARSAGGVDGAAPAGGQPAGEQGAVFALVGGGVDGTTSPKAHWLVPKSPRSPSRLRSDSFGSIGSSALSDPPSPGMLVGV